MAGHSKWANIKHRKGAQDKKRAKIFNRLSKEIMVAVKEGGGGDPDTNPRLRNAIAAAKSANMPNDRINRAIKAVTSGNEGDSYEDIRYEGYGPGGIALIVEALTDNRNRTAGEVRSLFAKFGGNLGETNSVSFMFDHVGSIFYPADTAGTEEMFEAAVEAGAENVESSESGHVIITSVDDFAAVRDALADKFGMSEDANLIWQPQTTITPDDSQVATLLQLIEALEDSDDVQTVSANYEIEDDVLERLLA